MIQLMIYLMVYLGSALMIYNIYGFIRFSRYVKGKTSWEEGSLILYVPIILLVFFLAGYLAIGIFGSPDLIVAGILFGGSIFVFVMYRMLSRIVQRITENEHLEAELLAAEESSRAKSSFLAAISHEMRTPMNVILGMDRLALRNPDLSDETRDQLEKIGHSARHLEGLINNILDIQEFENGEMHEGHKSFSLRDALDQINAVISSMCEVKGLTYEVTLAECASRDYVGDAGQLKRALMNILDNAVKFTDAPGQVHFTVDCIRENGICTALHFIISDTGVGIDEAFLPKIFEPFAQEDASFTNRFGGSGMGLAAAHSIVTHMGGEIRAESRKGEGSTFHVTVPIIQAPESEQTEGMCCGDGGCGAEPVSLDGRMILVVEDVDENAEIVEDLLELEGAESERASNGLEAVNMFKDSENWKYDAILMDLRMPVMDGLEAAGKIRALPRLDAKAVPIIALTANAYESDIQNSLKAGMNGHLVKPIDADELYAELRRWIRKTKGGNEAER